MAVSYWQLAIGYWLLAIGYWQKKRLKIAIKREQSQACLGYAKREQFGRSQNGNLNSRGFLNPWRKDISLKVRLKDGERQTCPRT